MKRWVQFTLLLIGIGSVLLFASPQRSSASVALARSYTGTTQIDGPLQLHVSISPAVSTPGNRLSLQVRLANQTSNQQTPRVRLALPSQLRLVGNTLPLGVTADLQNNRLNWLPVLPPNGLAEFSLSLRVETAAIAQAERTVTAVLNHNDTEKTAEIPIWIGIPPQITQVVQTTQVAVGQPIQLQPLLEGPGPFSQSWDLGDGRRVEVNSPEVVFPTTGIYEITLEVANPLATVSRQATITVAPHPVAQFRLEDATVSPEQPLIIANRSGGRPPLQYTWAFGDGTVSNEANPNHTYTSPGTYTVHLTVQNQFGRSDAYGAVTVGESPITDMELPEQTQTGEVIVGQAYGDDTVAAYRWDMGNGRFLEGKQVQYSYRLPGDYYVTMSAENEFGQTRIGRWVQVDLGEQALYLPLIFYAGGTNTADPLSLSLEPVALDEPFALEPMPAAAGLSPAEQLLFYVNEARRHFGREPLNLVQSLNVAAQQHAANMARFAYTGHIGADDSYPAERLLQFGYRQGYAGEATAWGFEFAHEAVEFWVNSDGHRRIVLNRFATDVGVGYTVDYNAPNVWYWTAEFGDAFAAVTQPVLRLATPQSGDEALVSDSLQYGWNWPLPLEGGQSFVVYLFDGDEVIPLGRVSQPQIGTRYRLTAAAFDAIGYVEEPGQYAWRVTLLDDNDNSVLDSEWRSFTLLPDFNLPTPTPPAAPSPTPTAVTSPTPSPTPLPTRSPATPLPPPPTLPPLVTVTPVPSPTPNQ